MKKRFVVLGSVVLLVLLGWTAGWFFLAAEVKKQVLALAEPSADAPSLACAELGVAGFPFRFDTTCTAATITQGDLAVTVAEVRASMLVYQPFHLLVFAKGPANITDAFTGTRHRLDWSDLEASVRIGDWRIARASAIIDQPILTDTLAGETRVAEATHAEFHLIDMPDQLNTDAHTAALAAYGTITALTATGLGIEQGEAQLEAELTGLPDDIRAFGDPEPIKRWQAAGGHLNIVGFKGNDADQSFNLGGVVSLDSAGKPDGSFKLTSLGLVDQLGEMVPPELRGFVLGQRAEDGSYSQTVTLRSGVAFSGLLPVGMIPPLW